MEDKKSREMLFKEIDLVQGVINRMGNNSFLVKGWAITLVVASFLLSNVSYYHFIAFLPWLVFWYMDAFFLQTEKLYRTLYNWLIANRPKNQDSLLEMDPKRLKERFGRDTPSLREVMFSRTLFAFYGLLFVIIIASMLLDMILSQKVI